MVTRVAPHPKVVGGSLAGAVIVILTTLTGLAKHDTTLAAGLATVAAALGGWTVPSQRPIRRGRRVPPRPPSQRPAVMHSMFDTIAITTIPPRPQAVAGYVGGRWPTYPQLVRRFPRAEHVSIAVNSQENADALDVEAGDASPDDTPGWVRRQHQRGIRRPIIYSSVSQMQRIIDLLQLDGIPRERVRIWTAHYTYHPHLCSPACHETFRDHADATQYTDRALGRNLDESLCATGFFA